MHGGVRVLEIVECEGSSAQVLASKSSSARPSTREHEYSHSMLAFKYRMSRTVAYIHQMFKVRAKLLM